MVTKSALFKVFLGSFFIQSAWSFEKMQGLGFAAAISPAIKELWQGEKRKEALKRHLAFYNAHPYMASPVLGAAIRLEERAREGTAAADAAVSFKKKIMGPYGAIGDSFFWGSVRPLASCFGILAALLWGFWGPIVFLAVYNSFHLWMRWQGLRKGYALGEGVVNYIREWELPRWSRRFHLIAMALLGACSAALSWNALRLLAPGTEGRYFAAGMLGATLLVIAFATFLSLFFKKGMTVSRLVYIIVVPLIVFGAVY